MKKFILTLFVLLSYAFHAQTHIWNGNGADHDWFNTSNWSAGTVPNESSTVFIEDDFVNITSGSATATSIELSLGAVLIVENDLNVSGEILIPFEGFLQIKSGNISTTTIQNFGSLTFETSDPKYLDNVTINNHLSMAVLNSGVIHLDNTVTINNFESGLVSINSPGGIVEDSGIATFNNQGNIVLDAPSPKSFYMIFDMNNEGVIEVRESHTFLFLVASQNFTNLPNGTLMGDGSFDITANFINNGLIDPANDGTTGTLDVLNNLHFPSEATLKIDVTSAAEYDVLDVFGSPTIEGVLEVNLLSGLNLNDELTIITSSNPLSCNLPSQVEAPFGDFDVYVFDVLCNANSVVLKVNTILLASEAFETQNITFIVSPNPAQEKIFFQFPNAASSKFSEMGITIFNIQGQKVAEFPVSDNDTLFDVSQFASGMYVAKLISEKGVLATTKLVVE